MRSVPLISVLIIFSFACAADGDGRATRADCQRVREHSADLRVAGITLHGDRTQVERERAKHKANFAEAGGEAYLESCVQQRTRKWIECSLSAKTLEKMSKCQ